MSGVPSSSRWNWARSSACPTPQKRRRRDEAMSAAVGPGIAEAPGLAPIEVGLRHPTAPHAGHAFVQGNVELDGRRARFDDVCGTGWRLVTNDVAADVDADLVAWFESIGGRVIALGRAGLVDVDATYAGWFEAHDSTWALQRPDYRLYGTTNSAPGAAELLRHLYENLASTTTPGGRS